MNIEEIHKNWTKLGEEDPMWVVLTDPDKKGNRWDEEEFFETGREQVNRALHDLEQSGFRIRFGRALDFGCGIGRLSQALAAHFASVDAVDVSSSMIEKARALNKHADRVHYHLNVSSDLSAFPTASFDFIYSVICLQHIPTEYQARYISEFIRVLKPGGVAYFQTIRARGWRRLMPNPLTEFYRRIKHRGRAFIPMYGISPKKVGGAVKSQGGLLREQISKPYDGCETRFAYVAVVAIKPE